MEQTAASSAVQYGVLGVVALVFAYAIVHLFKAMRTDTKAMETERKNWAVERETMRTEFERKHREVVEDYAAALEKERDSNRVHEDLVRKEFAELMEQVAQESGQSSQALVDMMQKLLDRIVGPSRGR